MHCQKNYTEIAKACNLGRNFDDIEDSWESVKKTIEFYKANAGDFASVARPGYFNDPDMVIRFTHFVIFGSNTSFFI